MKKYSILFILLTAVIASCVKDRVSTVSSGVINTGTRQLWHYWNFNSTDTSVMLQPTFTKGGGAISYDAAYFDAVSPGSSLNLRNGDDSGSGLRIRNPYNYMVLHAPTTGATKPILTFAVQRSSSGPSANSILYTTDGVNYVSSGIAANSITVGLDWTVYSFDFSTIPAADNNPAFSVKFLPTNNDTGSSGNNRYDNITIDAFPL